MQLANIISSNTLKRISLPYYLWSSTELSVYFAYQAMHSFCGFLLPPSQLFLSIPFSWFPQGASIHRFGNWQEETSSLFCFFPPHFHIWFVPTPHLSRDGSISVQILFKKLPKHSFMSFVFSAAFECGLPQRCLLLKFYSIRLTLDS